MAASIDAAMHKLRFRVVSFTSEDADYPASQLNEVNPSTRGWQSVRFCSYPQEIGLEMLDGTVHMSQIQLLSHQAKISSKVEIFIGQGPTYQSADFQRLGYLSLDSNERSSYQARELKTVFVDCVGSYLRFIVNENHVNKQNIYNQVGIVAISLMGSTDAAGAGSNGRGPIAAAVGKRAAAGAAAGFKSNPYNDLSIDLNLDPATANKLRELSDAKARAVDSEDYLTAKEIKAVENELKTLGSRLAQLDMAKADAVMNEDYDLAKDIKDESDQLRSEIEHKIMQIRIPGVAPGKAAPKVRPMSKASADSPQMQMHQMDMKRGPSAKFPVNVDDIVVGGGSSRGGGSDSNVDDFQDRFLPSSGSSKRAIKVEPMQHSSSADNRIGISTNDVDNNDDSDNMNHVPLSERPIRAGSNAYMDAAIGGIDDDPNGFQQAAAAGGGKKSVEKFPPGQHPLEGVSNFQELPAPESLSGKSREVADGGGIVALIGEYRSRCLFSKTWILREAAMTKVNLMLQTELVNEPGVNSCLTALATIIKVGIEDKIQQVLFSALALLEATLRAMRSAKVSRGVASPIFDPIIQQLVEKLADGNNRLREGARKGLDLIAAATGSLGTPVLAAHALRALPPKQKTAWRPISARLQLLTDLVRKYGVGGSTGLGVDAVLAFPKGCGAFAHSAAEVRDEAKHLVVAVQKLVGSGPVEPTLKLLRPKQLEEYQAAFSGDNNAAALDAKPAAPSRTDKSMQHQTNAPGGKVPTSAAKVADHKHGDSPQQQQQRNGGGNSSSSVGNGKGSKGHDQDGNGEEKQDFTACMFCGFHDKGWTENDLDVHYWKDCALLMSCPSCAQIVEIAGLPEHLLDECEAKDTYVPCETTGLAIRADEFDAWQRSPNCVPAPNNCMFCPLCLASVEDSDEAWQAHLTSGCPKNTRTNGS